MKIRRFYVFTIIALFVITSGTSTYAYTGHIAYVSDRDGQNEIYLMEMDGSNQTRLTNSTYDDITPVFSPDGQRIAFFSNRSGSYRIYTMNWNGTDIQEIPNSDCSIGTWNAGRGLAWSPDGQKLLFKPSPSNSSLATINLDGIGKTIIWDGPINGHGYIQGVEWGPTVDDIYVNAQNPWWGYDQHVFRKTNDGWTQITDDIEPLLSKSPQVSSQISRIVFDRQEDWPGPYNIYTMGLNGEDMVKLTFDTGGTWTCTPDWFNNGNGIVFSSNRSGSHQIWLMDSTGANQQMLQGIGNNYAPSWTPLAEPPSLDALVDINPDCLNKNSKGQWVTVYITLPAGYDVPKIDASTIAITSLTGTSCQPDYHQTADLSFVPQIGDRDEDGIPDLTVKFNRQELIANLCLDDVAVTVEGKLFTGEHFKGTDHIRVIERGK